MMLQEQLREFGLSEKEVKVYVVLLGLGSSIVSDIAKKALVNRSTAYIVLESLVTRGLVSIVGQGGKKTFTALPAEQLIRHLEDSAQHYADMAHAARTLLPTLKSLRKQKKDKQVVLTKPKVQFYEGAEGIKTVYEDTLASLETIRGHAVKKETLRVSSVSPKEFGTVPEITVYGNKIILVSPVEKFAAVVESRELADELRKILEVSRKEMKGKAPLLGSERIAKKPV